jgi:transposase-like protein
MRAPDLAVGDGALGFWTALREVFPTTREQRCWFHYADVRIMPTLMLDRLRRRVSHRERSGKARGRQADEAARRPGGLPLKT